MPVDPSARMTGKYSGLAPAMTNDGGIFYGVSPVNTPASDPRNSFCRAPSWLVGGCELQHLSDLIFRRQCHGQKSVYLFSRNSFWKFIREFRYKFWSRFAFNFPVFFSSAVVVWLGFSTSSGITGFPCNRIVAFTIWLFELLVRFYPRRAAEIWMRRRACRGFKAPLFPVFKIVG